MYETKGSESTTHKSPPTYLMVIWRIIYWSIQVLAWFAVPLSGTYVYNGEFTFVRRVLSSIRDHIITYVIMGSVGSVALIGLIVYIVVTNKYATTKIDLSFQMIAGIGQCLSASFGLLIMICLLGYGIVDIPRYLWQQADMKRSLTYIEFQAVKMDDAVNDSESALKEVLCDVQAYDEKVPADHALRPFVNMILKTCEKEFEYMRVRSTVLKPEDIETLKRSKLAQLHKRLKRAIATYYRCKYNWEYWQERAFFLQDVLDSIDHSSSQRKIDTPFRKQRTGIRASLFNIPEFYWYKYFRKVVMRSMAILFIPFAIVLMYCEFTPLFLFVIPKKKDNLHLSIFYHLIHALVNFRPLLQIVSLVIIGLMAFTAVFALFRIEVYSLYQLIPHHTDVGSILYTSVFLGRVCPSLCYNFLQMVGVTSKDSVAYYQIMGTLKLDGLKEIGSTLVSRPTIVQIVGGGFVNFFPLLLFVIALLNLFNVPSYIGVLFGRARFNFNPSSADQLTVEGREVLAKTRKRRMTLLEREAKSFSDLQSLDLVNPSFE